MKATKRIALVAHDERKTDLLAWADANTAVLATHDLYATGTTGKLLVDRCGFAVTRRRPSRQHSSKPKCMRCCALPANRRERLKLLDLSDDTLRCRFTVQSG